MKTLLNIPFSKHDMKTALQSVITLHIQVQALHTIILHSGIDWVIQIAV